MNDLEAFARLVQALAPWRRQLIFIGGGGIASTGWIEGQISRITNPCSLAIRTSHLPTRSPWKATSSKR